MWDGFHADILKEPINWENGYIIPSTKPGLGIELNEEVLVNTVLNSEAKVGMSTADTPTGTLDELPESIEKTLRTLDIQFKEIRFSVCSDVSHTGTFVKNGLC